MSEPLPVRVSPRAAAQVHAAETWWHANRPKAPGAILYYRFAEEPRRLEILAFWHASRGSQPPI